MPLPYSNKAIVGNEMKDFYKGLAERRRQERMDFRQQYQDELAANRDRAYSEAIRGRDALSGISVEDALVENLANTPGSGKEAYNVYQGQQQSLSEKQETVWKNLREGVKTDNPDLIRMAKQQAEQWQIPIPPAFFDDPEVRSEIVRVIDEYKSAGYGPEQIGIMLQDFLRKNPDLQQRILQSYMAGRGLPESLLQGSRMEQSKLAEPGARGGGGRGAGKDKDWELRKLVMKYAAQMRQDRDQNMEPGDEGWMTDEEIDRLAQRRARRILGADLTPTDEMKDLVFDPASGRFVPKADYQYR